MKINKYTISLLFLVVIAMLVSNVNGASTIVSPAASTSVGNVTTFNVTVAEVPSKDLINLTFYAKSTLSANSTWGQIGANNSLNVTAFSNSTITVISLAEKIEDSNDYIFNVTAINASGAGEVLSYDTNTGITVDNTIPTTPSALSPATATIDADGSVTFSATVTGSETTSCTLRFKQGNPGFASYTMTHTGNTCTRTLTGIPEQSYPWFVRASDETNTTDSGEVTVAVDISTGNLDLGALQEFGIEPSDQRALSVGGLGTTGGIPNGVILAIIAVVVIVVIIKLRKK